ncbi:hypothetical protein B0H14DRAFT_2587855 [Mycena olivaceomarginata]|nr:hypothetical protein B0H14DRAFT_2587855 [Mycena olivaceomarginata]
MTVPIGWQPFCLAPFLSLKLVAVLMPQKIALLDLLKKVLEHCQPPEQPEESFSGGTRLLAALSGTSLSMHYRGAEIKLIEPQLRVGSPQRVTTILVGVGLVQSHSST